MANYFGCVGVFVLTKSANAERYYRNYTKQQAKFPIHSNTSFLYGKLHCPQHKAPKVLCTTPLIVFSWSYAYLITEIHRLFHATRMYTLRRSFVGLPAIKTGVAYTAEIGKTTKLTCGF
jgi:hypothetical protein